MENIVEEVRKYVKEICDSVEHGDEYFNNHFSNVVRYSKLISEKSDSDKEIVEIAAWLHDVGGILYGRENHHITSSEIAEKKLIEFNYPLEKIEKVKHCILSHRGSKDIKRETIEAENLADADSMAHFDEIGGLFKYEFIIHGVDFKQKEAQKNVKEKLERSYKKLSSEAKKLIKPKYEAAMFLLGDETKNEKRKPGTGVGVMILNNGKVLLGKRHEDRDKADSELHGEGTWTMPGGKLEYGEDFIECAKRETLEECGIKLKNVEVRYVNNDKNEHSHFVTVGLFSDSFENEPQVMEPEEITEWRWFSLDELPKNIFFPSRKIIENYNKNKFYLEENNAIPSRN